MNRTTWILIGITIALAGYDVWAAVNKDSGDTITEVVRRVPAIVIFALGVLCGHFFWYSK